MTPIGDDRGKTHSTKHSTDDGGGGDSGDDGGDADTGAGADTVSGSSSDGSTTSGSERTECYSDPDTSDDKLLSTLRSLVIVKSNNNKD